MNKKSKKKVKGPPPAYYSDPAHSMGYLCRVGFRRFAKALENRTIHHGVSSGQWRFLRVLWQGDGITQRELSQRVDMREPTTVIAIQGLTRHGFVYRRADKADRRKVRVFLTAKASALRATLLPSVAEVNRIATAGVKRADIDTTRKVMMMMIENLAEEMAEQPRVKRRTSAALRG